MYVCIHAYMNTCTHVCIHADLHICIHACMHTCMFACMCASLHTEKDEFAATTPTNTVTNATPAPAALRPATRAPALTQWLNK